MLFGMFWRLSKVSFRLSNCANQCNLPCAAKHVPWHHWNNLRGALEWLCGRIIGFEMRTNVLCSRDVEVLVHWRGTNEKTDESVDVVTAFVNNMSDVA